jgi:hypothetical protein
VSGEQRPSQQWIVKVSGVEEVRVSPGESIEIGRKPMRPIANDEGKRLDVPDQSKSMSKRHARFQVTTSGSATLRDLASTNGSYIVRNDGGLIRVPLDTDFLLPRSPMRFQFGDVPVDFVKVEVSGEDKPVANDVSDLFTYATSEGAQEPDAADMSVDDILDLRAGEPTSAFDASSVRSRINALHDQALRDQQDFTAADDGGQTPNSVQAGLDAKATHNAEEANADGSDTSNTAGDAGHDDDAESTRVLETLAAGKAEASEGVGTDDASSARKEESGEDAGQGDAAHSSSQEPDASAAPAADDAGESAQSAEETNAADAAASAHGNVGEPQQRDLFADALDGVFAGDASSAQVPNASTGFQPLAAAQLASEEEERQRSVYERPSEQQTNEESGRSAAVYEPGSVFERVSKGDFEQRQPLVEVDGLSSDDARNSRDFAQQFEMAKHPELLPFLAMNVALYDDLYAWLAAQGNQDVDTALSKNQGYQEYVAATRK